MLTIEDKKKCFEFANGYSISYEEKWKSYIIKTPFTTRIVFLDNWDREISFKGDYSLFLQRVIEGMNKRPNIMVDQISSYVSAIYFNLKTKTQHPEGFDLLMFTPDEAKEQAIKHILGCLND